MGHRPRIRRAGLGARRWWRSCVGEEWAHGDPTGDAEASTDAESAESPNEQPAESTDSEGDGSGDVVDQAGDGEPSDVELIRENGEESDAVDDSTDPESTDEQ